MTMMHHPNMHHQPMTGHPSQHMPGHQGMPTHHQHQIPPHQMHRENRHVTLTRVPLGPSQAGGGLGAHTGMGAGMVPHHAPAHRPPHPIRPMPHHPQPQHHSMPPHPMKPLRRPFGAYGPGAGVMRPPYAPPHVQHPPATHPAHVGLCRPSSPVMSATKLNSDFVTTVNNSTVSPNTSPPSAVTGVGTGTGGAGAGAGDGARADADAEAGAGAGAAAGDGEAARPAAAQANSKEKTPMCLVNELARYNKIKHQYRLTSETGPAHKKIFTVTLRLGDTEEYTAEGSSIKRAQHAAAAAALAGTRFPPPPLRAPPAHSGAHPHHRHNGTVMPTVELNALAMKLCQPAVYTSIPPTVGTGVRGPRARAPPPPYRVPAPYGPHAHPHPHAPPYAGVGVGAALVYRVRVAVGGRAWLGEGDTPQAARHDAAARALRDLRLPPAPPAPPAPAAAPVALPPGADGADAALQGESGEAGAEALGAEVKSPVSLVHELALKRNLSVLFTVKSERGPPHMRVFVTSCAVGDMETEGEGNGKKVSKRRAAERMLEEMRRRWPPAALRPRAAAERRRLQPAKKKPRNLIKEGGGGGGGVAGGGGEGEGGADNPISRLAMARHAVRARSPQYRVLEERGAARRREFVVQCDAPPHRATGLGPNKKTAKRRAAHNVLLAMEMSGGAEAAPAAPATAATPATGLPDAGSANSLDAKRKDTESAAVGGVGGGAGSGGGCGGSGDVRQPVPGVLLMDYHQCSGQPPPPNGVSESSATGAAGAGPGPAGGAGGAGGSSPGAKDQLMYLAQLLGFTVQFSDFPKRNHGEYLSLVSLSTEPPVMCHGGGPSTAHSHEQCAAAALRALALMGLDAPPHPAPAPAPTTPAPAGMPPNMTTTNKTNVISNGISE